MRVSEWLFLMFVVAVMYLTVRPGSPAPQWIEGIGSMLSGSISLVTGG